MHPAPQFRETDQAVLIARAQAYPFAVITSIYDGKPVLAHAPVLSEVKDNRPYFRFHLAVSNPVCMALESGANALIVFTGDHAYVSPDWYGLPDQVGTWNYVSAEAEGVADTLDDAGLSHLLDDLSDTFEAPLAPKPMWTRAKMTDGKFEGMLRAIRGFTLTPTRFEGTTKLAQHKPADARARVANHLRAADGGMAIAKMMDKLT